MENDSLAELKWLIEEEIYLIPEDRKAILAQLETSLAVSSSTKPAEPIPSESRDKSTTVVALSKQADPNPEPENPQEELISVPIAVRGNFSKGVLILHEEPTLRPELMEMLVKMINACGHSMNEIGLLASGDLEGRSMDEFKNLNAHTILKFGRINHPINAVSTRPYEVYAENETEYLFADSLSAIAEDVSLKKKLWTSLQVLFQLT
jgi:hypothetical protein